MPLCNGKPDCAPILWGVPFLLCWRCTAIAVSAMLAYAAGFIVPGGIAVLLAVPCIVDGSLGYLGVRPGTNWRRASTGTLAGLSLPTAALELERIFGPLVPF